MHQLEQHQICREQVRKYSNTGAKSATASLGGYDCRTAFRPEWVLCPFWALCQVALYAHECVAARRGGDRAGEVVDPGSPRGEGTSISHKRTGGHRPEKRPLRRRVSSQHTLALPCGVSARVVRRCRRVDFGGAVSEVVWADGELSKVATLFRVSLLSCLFSSSAGCL